MRTMPQTKSYMIIVFLLSEGNQLLDCCWLIEYLGGKPDKSYRPETPQVTVSTPAAGSAPYLSLEMSDTTSLFSHVYIYTIVE